jgi:hypothetical protein
MELVLDKYGNGETIKYNKDMIEFFSYILEVFVGTQTSERKEFEQIRAV